MDEEHHHLFWRESPLVTGFKEDLQHTEGSVGRRLQGFGEPGKVVQHLARGRIGGREDGGVGNAL